MVSRLRFKLSTKNSNELLILNIMLYEFNLFNGSLDEISPTKKLITTLNAHSYNTLYDDIIFKEALKNSDILLPDGVSMVWASSILKGKSIRKIAGEDLFFYEMERVNKIKGKCFFLGSTEENLKLIKERAIREFPNISISTYSPPFKPVFDENDNQLILDKINNIEPDALFVGMTAPKQEKWAFNNLHRINAGHICCIGAVFDFYAGTIKRAPKWIINLGLEWLYRLLKEPRRMWRRYIIGNSIFIARILRSKLLYSKTSKANSLITSEIKSSENKRKV